MKKLKRTATSAILGNALVMYDFALYTIFAKIIAAEFFPKTDENVALLATLAIYASGFFMRPFGGLVFGHLGDIFGRKWVLSVTVLFMALPTFIIGILPNYDSIGMWASIIILLCRLLQGLCAGAEYSGASIFLIEHFNAKRLPAFAGSLISASGALGTILGVCAYYLVSKNILHWREPFIFGAILILIAFYIRRYTDESPEFNNGVKKISSPLLHIFKHHKKSLMATIAIGAFQGTLAYLLFVYMKIYMQTQTSLQLDDITYFNLIALIAFLFSTPLFGFYAGKIGHLKVMRIGLLTLLIYLYPCFNMVLSHDYGVILMSQFFLGVLVGLSACAASAVMNNLFPTNLRCSGILFGYNLGVALFGGALPLVSEWYITSFNYQYAPAVFCMITILIGMSAIQILIPKSQETQFSTRTV